MRSLVAALVLAALSIADANAQQQRTPQSAPGAPFDRGAAAAALGAAAGSIQSCKKAGGPTGGGKVKVTFAPQGNVASAEIDSGPPFAGTPVGGCIAGKFKAAHVPAFSGQPVTVDKAFTLN